MRTEFKLHILGQTFTKVTETELQRNEVVRQLITRDGLIDISPPDVPGTFRFLNPNAVGYFEYKEIP